MALLSILMVLVYLGAITYLIGLPVMVVTLRERVASLMREVVSLSREIEGIEKTRTVDAVSSAMVRTIVDAHSAELIAQLQRIHEGRREVQAALAAMEMRMEARLDRHAGKDAV